jgi:hypothetical protein
MSQYTFIKNPNRYENQIFAIDSNKFEEMPLANVYDQYGQILGHFDAGDYIECLSQECRHFAHEFNSSNYNTISAYDNWDWFQEIINSSELVQGIDYELEQTTVTGFTYWNGHNWQSIVLDCIEYPSGWEIVENPELENLSFENMETILKNGYGTDYRVGNHKISTSNWQESRWLEYKIELDYYAE